MLRLSSLRELWSGKYKGLGAGSEDYEIEEDVWDEIWAETAAATGDIPAQFVRVLSDTPGYFTADAWCFWFMYLASILLSGRFQDDKYYTHACQFSEIIKSCIAFQITYSEIDDLQANIIDWVQKYEDTGKIACLLVRSPFMVFYTSRIAFVSAVWNGLHGHSGWNTFAGTRSISAKPGGPRSSEAARRWGKIDSTGGTGGRCARQDGQSKGDPASFESTYSVLASGCEGMRQHGLLAAAPKDGVRGRPVLGGYRRAAGSRGHIDASLGARARRSRTISSNWAQHARRMTMSMRSGLNPGMGVEAKSREGDTGDRRGSAQPAGPLPTRTYDATHRRRTPWARDIGTGGASNICIRYCTDCRVAGIGI
ncbi:hypothetical protein B0H14DRAFT_3522917 [Mycena olivaceomarginata]|nr:hypothetical protein B0H14DRAFT_3522917 [Mycena olivaceomarginata]